MREETGLDATVGDPLVVFKQTYVDADCDTVAFEAEYVVYTATAAGDSPDPSRLAVEDGEIRDARWFEHSPERLHDGTLLRQYVGEG